MLTYSLENNEEDCDVTAARRRRNLKIGLQLYKVHDGRYLLDFRLLNGDTFLFFDMCSELINDLELYEVTLAEIPVNSMSKFEVLWNPKKVEY